MMESEYPNVTSFVRRYEAAYEKAGSSNAELIRHLVSSIESAKHCRQPFSFSECGNFLPRDTYCELLDLWPTNGEFSEILDETGNRLLGERQLLLVEERPSSKRSGNDSKVMGPNELPQVLHEISVALGSPTVVAAIFKKYAEHLEEQLAAFSPHDTDIPGFRMYACRDRGEREALYAHVDALRKLVTIVIYIDLGGHTSAESPSLWGTKLYDNENGEYKPYSFSSNNDHRSAYTVSFQENTAFLMPNSPLALHGVSGGEPGVERRTLMCGYWLFGSEVGQKAAKG